MFYTLINPMDATNQVIIEIKELDLLRFKNSWSNIKNFAHTISQLECQSLETCLQCTEKLNSCHSFLQLSI